MGRTFLIVALVAVLTVPVALAADRSGGSRAAQATDGTLSIKRGRGLVVLKTKGTVIGRANNARIQVKDMKPFDANKPQLFGCKPKIRHPNFSTSVCQGKKVTFRILDGRFNTTVRGNAIFLSAVGKGTVSIDGIGETGVDDGVMSLNNAPYESLPDVATTYQLETPAPAPTSGQRGG
jgi:hypothetical protein